jgi:hypothetical protein
MRAFHPYAFVLAGAPLLVLACASDVTPASDAGRDARPDDRGMHPNGDASVPGVHHPGNDGATDAAVAKPSGGHGSTPDAIVDAAPRVHDASANAPPGLADAAEASVPDADRSPAGYPKGHYGTEVGNTFPFLRWEGYVEGRVDGGLVSDGPWTTYSSDDLRRSGKRLAIVHLTDFDCPGCRHAATELDARMADAGTDDPAVVEILGSISIQAAPADRNHLQAWITTYGLYVTTVIDAPGHELATLNSFGIRETALVVELATMQVVYRSTGNLAPNGPTGLDDAFDYVHHALRD